MKQRHNAKSKQRTKCPPHNEAVITRDGKECRKCGLSWRLALLENRKAKRLLEGER